MRTLKIAALVGAAALSALWMAACNREGAAPAGGSRTASANQGQPSQPPAPPAAFPAAPPALGTGGTAPGQAPMPGQPQTSELQPRPQSVTVGNAPPAPTPAPEHRGKERQLAARERRLAQRQAALEARERRLSREESQAAAGAAGTAPGPPGAAGESTAAGPAASAAAPDEPGPAPAPAAGSEERQPEPVPVTVPAGTSFEVEFTQGLASNTSSAGETFRARIVSDVRRDGAVAIPAGSEVLGVVTDAVGARRIGGQAKLTVKFTDLVLPSGSTVPLRASFVEEGKSRAGRDAATIGGSTAGGALLGRILSNGSRTRGTIIGALVGAAVGTAIAAKTAGEEVVIPEGSVVSLKLDEPLAVKGQR
jgi:type IV secretory pathway VirB10-like protein